MKYQLGIGRASFETDSAYDANVIREFLQSMNKQGEIGFWEKKIDNGDSTIPSPLYNKFGQQIREVTQSEIDWSL
jgi:hypothetical protein